MHHHRHCSSPSEKKAEAAARKAEARRLAEIEETEIEKSLKKVDKKANRVSIPVPKVTEAELIRRKEEPAQILKRAEEEKRRQSRTAKEEYEKMVLVKNTNRDDSIIEARSVEEAIAQISVADSLPVDKHPEKRLRTSFKEKKENNDLEETLPEIKNAEVEAAAKPVKKRKKKAAASDPVEGFRVFKSSKTEPVLEENEEAENASQGKKELCRQMERDANFRKKHKIHTSGSNIPSPLQDFSELRSRYKCKPYILQNLAELGIKEPTPIQMQAIPILLSGRECFTCAPTGSGKTLAFVCPMLMKLKRASKDGVRAVILCPTRELASQTYRECKKLAKGKKFYIKLMTKQLTNSAEFSKVPCDILISTPLRLKFAVTKRKLDLSRVEYLVLDESDKLFELGLLKQVDAVVKACSNPSIIRSLFSATLPDTVEELARTIMHDAVRVIIGRKNTASESIKQKLVFVGSEEGKLLALRQTFGESLNPPVLVFVQNKERAKDLYKELRYGDIRVDVIHSDLPQLQRENAIDNFRAGKTWVLIATDVIARGMDFKGVNCVINYDFPDSSSAYIHRIGRSGRAGRSGEAVTFYTEADVRYLKNIANVIKASGCEVPAWILSLPKLRWKNHRPKREFMSTKPQDEEE